MAPQEVLLVKTIVDAAHAGHQSGTPIAPLPVSSPVVTQQSPTPASVQSPTTSDDALNVTLTGQKPVLQKNG